MESLQEAATQEKGIRLCELGRRFSWHGGLGEGRGSGGGLGAADAAAAAAGGGGEAGLALASGVWRVCVHQPMRKQLGGHWRDEQVRAEETEKRGGRAFC